MYKPPDQYFKYLIDAMGKNGGTATISVYIVTDSTGRYASMKPANLNVLIRTTRNSTPPTVHVLANPSLCMFHAGSRICGNGND
jgi:hypothetical protein